MARGMRGVGDWLGKWLRGKTAKTEADDLLQARGAAEGESMRPVVVGRRTTDESGTDAGAERPNVGGG